jgi:hypothetical protein
LIKNADLLKKLEDGFIRETGRLTHAQSLRIFEALWKEGMRLGVLPPKDPWEGIEVDIQVAKILNSCLKQSSKG